MDSAYAEGPKWRKECDRKEKLDFDSVFTGSTWNHLRPWESHGLRYQEADGWWEGSKC